MKLETFTVGKWTLRFQTGREEKRHQNEKGRVEEEDAKGGETDGGEVGIDE